MFAVPTGDTPLPSVFISFIGAASFISWRVAHDPCERQNMMHMIGSPLPQMVPHATTIQVIFGEHLEGTASKVLWHVKGN